MPSATTATTPSRAALDLLSGLLQDAVALTARGCATRVDIDTAMRLGAGHPAGPFEVMATLAAHELHRLHIPGGGTTGTSSFKTESSPDVRWTGPVGVVGSGHMAGGIVEAVARSGRPVRVLARSTASGQGLVTRVTASLDRAMSRGRLDGAARDDVVRRVTFTQRPADLGDTDVVIEAVAEDLDVKAAVITRLDAALPPSVPLATNTSSFRVADLRTFVAGPRPLLALHFFNPAQVMKLVEVVVPDDAPDADGLRTTAVAWARDVGKTPITCADSRGFVVNRLLIPFLNDAVRLHENGMSAAEVDELLTIGAGHPMGPLALVDLIGVDVTVAALESMAAVEDDPRNSPAPTLRGLLAAGRLGRKTGSGFHTYA